MEEDKSRLSPGCRHEYKLGPVTDKLLRHRPAVCVKCWDYEEALPSAVWDNYEVWTPEHGLRYEREVEEHFGKLVRE